MLRLCCNVVLSITGTAVLGISAQMKTFGWIFTPLTLVRLGWYTSTVDPFAETANGWSFHGTLGNCIPPTRVFEVEAAKGGYKLAIDIFSFQSIQHLSARFSLGSISNQRFIVGKHNLPQNPSCFFSKWQDWCCGDLGDGAFGSRDLR